MNSGVIQKTFIAIALIVLAFVGGSLVADGKQEGLGFVVAVAGFFAVIALGRRCWWLIFLVPPILNLFSFDILEKVPVGYVLSAGIMVYWCVLCTIGSAGMTWRSLWWMEAALALLVALFAYSYYCHPVIMGFLAERGTRIVGGSGYLWCLFGMIYYISVSALPCTRQELTKVLGYAVLLIAVSATINAGLNLARGGNEAGASLGEQMGETRFTALGEVGKVICLLIVCRFRLLKVLLSPHWLFVFLLGVGMVFLSGFRTHFVVLALMIIFIALVRREYIMLALVALLSYGSIIFLSSSRLMLDLPMGIQRTLSIVPGAQVSENASRDAEHSSDWRVVMWEWAMDPRTGYIRDYTWGDGFGVDMEEQARFLRRAYRYKVEGALGDPRKFAASGTWHSGIISTIHRMGYVGLVVLSIWFACGLLLIFRACSAYNGRKEQFLYLYFTIQCLNDIGPFYLSVHGPAAGAKVISYFVVAKLLYCYAREEGLLRPLFSRETYVPRMLRWKEEKGLADAVDVRAEVTGDPPPQAGSLSAPR